MGRITVSENITRCKTFVARNIISSHGKDTMDVCSTCGRTEVNHEPALEWENIGIWDSRTKVFGGWIVKCTEPVYHLSTESIEGGNGWDWRISTCFVPDSKHEWDLFDERYQS